MLEGFIKASDNAGKQLEKAIDTAVDFLNKKLSLIWDKLTHISTEEIAKRDGLDRVPGDINRILDNVLDRAFNVISPQK